MASSHTKSDCMAECGIDKGVYNLTNQGVFRHPRVTRGPRLPLETCWLGSPSHLRLPLVADSRFVSSVPPVILLRSAPLRSAFLLPHSYVVPHHAQPHLVSRVREETYKLLSPIAVFSGPADRARLAAYARSRHAARCGTACRSVTGEEAPEEVETKKQAEVLKAPVWETLHPVNARWAARSRRGSLLPTSLGWLGSC